MKLAGLKTDGTSFAINANARTTRIRLYKETDVARVDLAGIGAAAALAIFESGMDDAIQWLHLDELAALPALTDLTLSVDAVTDLSPLARAPALKHLHLYVHGRDAFDTSWTAKIATLESLSLSFKGGAPVLDVDALRVSRLSLSGIGNTSLKFGGLESINVTGAPALVSLGVDAGSKYVHVMQCPALQSLTIAPASASPLENFHLANLPQLTKLDLSPLAQCSALRSLTLHDVGVPLVDITPVASIATLASISIDGKNAPFLSATADVVAPGVRALERIGRLHRE